MKFTVHCTMIQNFGSEILSVCRNCLKIHKQVMKFTLHKYSAPRYTRLVNKHFRFQAHQWIVVGTFGCLGPSMISQLLPALLPAKTENQTHHHKRLAKSVAGDKVSHTGSTELKIQLSQYRKRPQATTWDRNTQKGEQHNHRDGGCSNARPIRKLGLSRLLSNICLVLRGALIKESLVHLHEYLQCVVDKALNGSRVPER